jgi:formate--tetrahydrofolate ligase
MSLPSDLEIARSVTPRPITEIATELGIADDELELYGPTKAKVTLGAIERLEAERPAGSTSSSRRSRRRRSGRASRRRPSVSPRGSTGSDGRRPVCIRQPSLGPGLRDQGRCRRRWLQPGHPDGGLQPPPDRRRPRDRGRAQPGCGVPRQPPPPRQRARASTSTPSSGRGSSTSATAPCGAPSSGSVDKENGVPRETEYVITVASEVMAVLALASDLFDLRARLGRIVVATTRTVGGHDGGPRRRRVDDRAPARRDQAEPPPDP